MTDVLLDLGRAAGVLAAFAALGYALYRVLRFVLNQWLLRRSSSAVQVFMARCAAPARLFLPLLTAYAGLPLALQEPSLTVARQGMSIVLIATAAWLLLRALVATDTVISSRLNVNQPDNLDARRMQTQLRVIRGVLATIVLVGAAISILFTFPELRRLGAGLLASAGVAGIIAGLAAQKVLANLIAGFQVGFTQPIRLDDVVVVEGEWGRIEEITLTYVVVRIWDERRLVLPISYFLEKPFANWTRQSADLLGTVFLYVDYTAPVDEIRAELQRIAEASERWDGRVCGLQVTDAREQTMELRALVSAKDSPTAFDLRCEVREKLLAFLSRKYPASLPRVRAELDRDKLKD